MFEEYTFEYLMKRALSRVSGDVDKRQGSIIYDAIAPACAELCQAYIELDRVIDESFADTSSREYLIKRAKERGLEPKSATFSIVLADLKGDFKIQSGARFSLDEVNYFYLGEKEGEYYKLKCETAGEVGNNSFGTLIPIDNISGLKSAEVIKLFFEGEEDEDTEVFRKRYFDSFNGQAFGGNIKDYMEKVSELNKIEDIVNNGGIGGIKIYPVWNGGGTVKIVFTSKAYNEPTQSLIGLVQEELDPSNKAGEGEGLAPIGHFVTVEGVASVMVNINTKLSFKNGYNWADVSKYVENAVSEYLKELCKEWADNDYLTIRVSQIEAVILNVVVNNEKCIEDIAETKLNNNMGNLVLSENQIPCIGRIEVG